MLIEEKRKKNGKCFGKEFVGAGSLSFFSFFSPFVWLLLADWLVLVLLVVILFYVSPCFLFFSLKSQVLGAFPFSFLSSLSHFVQKSVLVSLSLPLPQRPKKSGWLGYTHIYTHTNTCSKSFREGWGGCDEIERGKCGCLSSKQASQLQKHPQSQRGPDKFGVGGYTLDIEVALGKRRQI